MTDRRIHFLLGQEGGCESNGWADLGGQERGQPCPRDQLGWGKSARTKLSARLSLGSVRVQEGGRVAHLTNMCFLVRAPLSTTGIWLSV